MSFWWKRFKPNKVILPAAAVATALSALALLTLWTPQPSDKAHMDRYGTALARTLALSSAGHLLHTDRIELAVIANDIAAYPEVDGVVFYNAANDILAMSGVTELVDHYPAPATLDDTITGYVSVVLNQSAFAPPPRSGRWLLTVLALLAIPFLTVAALQLSARGNRSLPIVSVPETPPAKPQSSFALIINLHNHLALNREQRQQAVEDAMTMATELCAIHQGLALTVPGRGVMILLDRHSVDAAGAICASFLIQRLLSEFETAGAFRCCLGEVVCPDSPGELAHIQLSELEEDNKVDGLFTLAALARKGTTVIAEPVYAALSATEQAWSQPFNHPLLADLDAQGPHYLIEDLPDAQAQLVDSQALLILGFNQASA